MGATRLVSPYVVPGIKRELTDKFGVNDLFKVIEEVTGISKERMLVKTRVRSVVVARQIFFHFTRKYTKLSLTQIGSIFNQDHATVLHGIRQVKSLRDAKDKPFLEIFNQVNNIVEERLA